MNLINRILATILFSSLSLFGISQATHNADCKDTVVYHPSGQVWKKYKRCPEGAVDTMYIFRKNRELEAWFYFGSSENKNGVAENRPE